MWAKEQLSPDPDAHTSSVAVAAKHALKAAASYNGTWEGREGWELWLAIRNELSKSCNYERWRYSDDQIYHHYVKDLDYLEKICIKLKLSSISIHNGNEHVPGS